MPHYGDREQEEFYEDVMVHVRDHGLITVVGWLAELLAEFVVELKGELIVVVDDNPEQ